MKNYDIDEISKLIKNLRYSAEELKVKSNGIQAIVRNVDRILVCVKILEINVPDMKDLV